MCAYILMFVFFFFSSRRRHTSCGRDWSSDVCSSDLGAAQLADGTAQAAAGGQLLKSTVDSAADRIEPVLRANGPAIAQAASALADGADTIADNIQALPDLAGQAVTRATAVRDRLDALVTAHPELANDPAFTAARSAADAAVTAATAVRDRIDAAGLDRLREQLRQVAAGARQLAVDAPHLADDVAAARSRVDRFAAGLGQLATGADRLHQGTSEAHDGAVQLSGGLYRLSTGARQLDTGLSALDAGAHRLAGGLSSLQSGADQLAGGLSDGANPGVRPGRYRRASRGPGRPGGPAAPGAPPGRHLRGRVRAVLRRAGAVGRCDDPVPAAAPGEPAPRADRGPALAGGARRAGCPPSRSAWRRRCCCSPCCTSRSGCARSTPWRPWATCCSSRSRSPRWCSGSGPGSARPGGWPRSRC